MRFAILPGEASYQIALTDTMPEGRFKTAADAARSVLDTYYPGWPEDPTAHLTRAQRITRNWLLQVVAGTRPLPGMSSGVEFGRLRDLPERRTVARRPSR